MYRRLDLVSAADKLHNARSTAKDYAVLGDAVWQRFNAGREQTLWYYKQLLAAYRSGPKDERRVAIVCELESIVDQLSGQTSTPTV